MVFFDRLKNVSSGYASLSYELAELRPASVTRLDVLVAEEIVPAFSRVVGLYRAESEARTVVDKLYRPFTQTAVCCQNTGKGNG